MIENIVKKFALRSKEPTFAVEKSSQQPLMVIWGRRNMGLHFGLTMPYVSFPLVWGCKFTLSRAFLV